jgi:hypothetical protein
MILLLLSCNWISRFMKCLLNYRTQKLIFCTEKMALFDNIFFKTKILTNKQLKIKNTQNYLYFYVTSKRFFKQK